MPKLKITRQRLSPLSTVGRRPALSRPVSDAQGTAQLGTALQRIGQVTGDILQKRATQAEQSNLYTQLADYETKQGIALKEAARNSIPNSPSGILENPRGDVWDVEFADNFNKGLDEIGTGLVTPQARLQFDQAKARLTARFNEELALNRQAISGKKAQLKVNSIKQSRMMDVGNNPNRLFSVFDEYVNDMAGVADLYDVSSLDMQATLQADRFDFGVTAVQGLIQKNPEGALKALKAGKYDDFLQPKQKNTLLNSAKSTVQAGINAAANNDKLKVTAPYKYMSNIGQPIPNLDISIESFGTADMEKIVQRAVFIKKTMAEKGIVKMDLISPDQSAAFVQFFDEKPKEALEFFQRFDTSLDGFTVEEEDAKSYFMKSIFKQDPGMAAAALAAGENPDFTGLVMKGRQLSRKVAAGTLKATEIPNTTKISSMLDGLWGSALLESGQIDARAAIKTAVTHAYIAAATEDSTIDLAADPDPQLIQQISDAAFPVIELNNKNVGSFYVDKVPLDQDSFTVALDAVTDEKFLKTQTGFPVAKNRKEIKGANLVRFLTEEAKLVTIGPGLYQISNAFKSSDLREPFVFNMKKLVEDFEINPEDLIRINSASNFGRLKFSGFGARQ